MFDAQRLLGTLVSTGMGGLLGGAGPAGAQEGDAGGQPVPSGSSFSQAAGGGLGGAASLAMLGTLAYKAYQSYAQNQPQAGAAGGQASFPGQGLFATLGGASGLGSALGLGGATGASAAPQPAAAAPQVTNDDACTLIRAMVAAANADGHIDPDEEARLHQALEQAGASEEERRFLASETQTPASVDMLARQAADPEMAAHIYAASLLGIADFNATNQSYLRYLANRMGLDGGTVTALHRQVGAPTPS